MDSERNSATLERRRETLKETLKLQPLQQPAPANAQEDSATTSFGGNSNARDLLESLRVSRLKRQGKLPPLEGTISRPPEPSRPDHTEAGGSGLDTAVPEGPRNEAPRKLQGLRDRLRSTRFDESLANESITKDSDLEGGFPVPPAAVNSTSSLSKWKALSNRISEATVKTAVQDAYDFFTSAVEDQQEVQLPDESNDLQDGPHEPQESEGLSKQTGSLDEAADGVSGDNEADNEGEIEAAPAVAVPLEVGRRGLVQQGPARYTPLRERLGREASAYFTPSSQPEPAERKTPGASPPVCLEEEGLFVGDRPHVRWTNQVVVENRLLKRGEKPEGWFGADGLLRTQPCPLREVVTRPSVTSGGGEGGEIKTLFRKARNESYSQKLIDRGCEGREGRYQLELEVSSLQLSHHPLFSREHVLAARLQQACSQLNQPARTRTLLYYRERLEALRKAVHDLKQVLLQTEGSSPGLPALQVQYQEYRAALSSVRQLRRQEERAGQSLVAGILRCWAELKAVREAQGYSSTTTWLTVSRQPTDAVAEEAWLQRELDEELAERREDFESEGRERTLHYQQQLSEWKAYDKARRKALRRATQLLEQAGGASEEGSQNSLTDPMLAVPPERPRPIPPPVFDEEEERRQLVAEMRGNCRAPGEPLLIPRLHYMHTITQHCSRAEQQRREEAQRARFFLQVLFNNHQVSHTREGSLTSNFSVQFSEPFSIRIVQWPENIKLRVMESGLLSPNLLAEVFIPIPDPQNTVSCGMDFENYQFSNSKVVSCSHAGVGSGESHSWSNEILITSGAVKVGVAWAEDDKGRALCPPDFRQTSAFRSPHTDAIHSLGVAGIADLQEVKKWIEQSRLDPNNPRNAKLLQLVHTIPNSADEAQHFRLLDLDNTQRFTTNDNFENNRRFHLLQQRQQGHPGLNHKSVPLNPGAISESVWRGVVEYRPYQDYDLPLLYFGDFHSARKEEQNKFLLDVRERVLYRAHSARANLTYEDVVHSEIVPSISALKNTVKELFAPRRPLKPKRKGHRKPKPQNVHVSKASIVVRVVRAYNVPTRMDTQPPNRTPPTLSTSEDADTTALDYNQVWPFVEVQYRGRVKRTSTANGPNPFWNEELSLPFHPHNDDFSPGNLQREMGALHITLFDEFVVDLLSDHRQRETSVHQRKEKRWLGSYTLPFSTLHLRTRIEGMFLLSVPTVLLGYQQSAAANAVSLQPDMASSQKHTYLHLFIVLEPALSALPPLRDQFSSSEEPHMLQHSRTWLERLKETHPNRKYTATVLDISGRHVFVTRFIKAQQPPSELLPTELSSGNRTTQLMERLARYVSLIPFLPDAIAFSGACDIWSTSDQFLAMLAGDEEEHAVLLCNYFLHCGWRAWLLLGSAVPEGETAYVLTEVPQSGGYWLWNASTGMHFTQHQPFCPLTSVGCVVNDKNVWANVQENDDPSRMVFDLTNGKYWKPLFPMTTESIPLSSVQQVLHYSETDLEKVHQLEERIERTVRELVMTLRSRSITRWNRHCCRKLQTLLPLFEEQLNSFPQQQHQSELAEITASYKIVGFPLHCGYSDTQHIVSCVECSGVHHCENPAVEFALAVYIHPYPNDVLSVWIYMATLLPK